MTWQLGFCLPKYYLYRWYMFANGGGGNTRVWIAIVGVCIYLLTYLLHGVVKVQQRTLAFEDY